jgi:hypothetical protein
MLSFQGAILALLPVIPRWSMVILSVMRMVLGVVSDVVSALFTLRGRCDNGLETSSLIPPGRRGKVRRRFEMSCEGVM